MNQSNQGATDVFVFIQQSDDQNVQDTHEDTREKKKHKKRKDKVSKLGNQGIGHIACFKLDWVTSNR